MRKLIGTTVFLGVGAIVALALLIPRLLHAQQPGASGAAKPDGCPMMGSSSPGSSMMGGCPMGECPMMEGSAFEPASALEHREVLALIAEQVTALENVASDVQQQRTEASSEVRGLRAKLDAAMQADRFDETAVRRALDEVGEAHTDLAVASLRAQHVARATLTAEQGERLARIQADQTGMSMCMQMMHGGFRA